ncbi:MAG: hypothetical protein ACPGSD_12875 [Flavobacteriales bacterium]
MGIFEKLFVKKKESSSSSQHKLRLRYNVMSEISIDCCLKYKNEQEYKLINHGIYEYLKEEDVYRMTISYQLKSENNTQYPMEDILDKYYLHVSDFLDSENDKNSNVFKLEVEGSLEDLVQSQEIIGKEVFNREFIADDGQVRVKLIIE